jgi:hypothetical protein
LTQLYTKNDVCHNIPLNTKKQPFPSQNEYTKVFYYEIKDFKHLVKEVIKFLKWKYTEQNFCGPHLVVAAYHIKKSLYIEIIIAP